MGGKVVGLIFCGFFLVACGGTPPNITGKWVEKNPRTLAEAAAAHNEKNYVTGFTEIFAGSTLEFKPGGDLVIAKLEGDVGFRILGNYSIGSRRIRFSISSSEPIGQSSRRFDSVNSSMDFAKKLGLLPPISERYEMGKDGSLTFIGMDGGRHTWVRVDE
jgi:hypothetical protein